MTGNEDGFFAKVEGKAVAKAPFGEEPLFAQGIAFEWRIETYPFFLFLPHLKVMMNVLEGQCGRG